MKKRLLYIYLLFTFIGVTGVAAQQLWSFDTTDPLGSNENKKLTLHSIRIYPELVEGIKGKALRTDGYTTWLTANFIPAEEIKSISGWFALESYPTDTAAFYGIMNSEHQQSISVCVDRYGAILLNTGGNGIYTYLPTGQKIERFEWIHLSLVINPGTVTIYINGNKTELLLTTPLQTNTFDRLIIGKDFKNKKSGIHDLTAINGIADEIKTGHTIPSPQEIQQELAVKGDKKPVLAIPASRFENDFSRPQYHLLPVANWTNETHGLFYHNGRYHIFNQKNGSNLFLGQINWGHFSSPDLLHWTEHKPAITPEPGYDCNGIWSGHAVIDDSGQPVLIYTAGGEKMGVGLAYPKDTHVIEWEKYKGNPVITEKPDAYARTDMRDQYVWKEGDNWYMIIGFGVVENKVEKGALLLYKSKDLKEWDFIHTLFEGNPEIDNSGIFWEMPVFWKHDSKYTLLVNRVPHNGIPARTQYWTGEFKDERFIPDNPIPENLEVINRLLSPSVSYDKEGRITAIAIIPDEIGGAAAYEHGWTHLYSMPRVWNFNNGKIEQTPHPVLQELRGEKTNINRTKVEKEHPLLLTNKDNQVEIKATFYPDGTQKFGFLIHHNPDNSEYTKIYYDNSGKEIIVDQRYSSLKKHIPLQVRKDRYEIDTTKPVEFHLFIDGSVVEVFINNKDAFTTRIFPQQKESAQCCIFTEDTPIEITAEVWQLRPAPVSADF